MSAIGETGYERLDLVIERAAEHPNETAWVSGKLLPYRDVPVAIDSGEVGMRPAYDAVRPVSAEDMARARQIISWSTNKGSEIRKEYADEISGLEGKLEQLSQVHNGGFQPQFSIEALHNQAEKVREIEPTALSV
ncbi:MAG: hypothetical protein ACR2PI_18870 [Hyphomicrobiaceae bacterium]